MSGRGKRFYKNLFLQDLKEYLQNLRNPFIDPL